MDITKVKEKVAPVTSGQDKQSENVFPTTPQLDTCTPASNCSNVDIFDKVKPKSAFSLRDEFAEGSAALPADAPNQSCSLTTEACGSQPVQKITSNDAKKVQESRLDRDILIALSKQKFDRKSEPSYTVETKIGEKQVESSVGAPKEFPVLPSNLPASVHAYPYNKTEVPANLGELSPAERLQYAKRLINKKLVAKASAASAAAAAAKPSLTSNQTPAISIPATATEIKLKSNLKSLSVAKTKSGPRTTTYKIVNFEPEEPLPRATVKPTERKSIKTPQDVARVLDFSSGASSKLSDQPSKAFNSIEMELKTENLQPGKMTENYISKKAHSNRIESLATETVRQKEKSRSNTEFQSHHDQEEMSKCPRRVYITKPNDLEQSSTQLTVKEVQKPAPDLQNLYQQEFVEVEVHIVDSKSNAHRKSQKIQQKQKCSRSRKSFSPNRDSNLKKIHKKQQIQQFLQQRQQEYQQQQRQQREQYLSNESNTVTASNFQRQDTKTNNADDEPIPKASIRPLSKSVSKPKSSSAPKTTNFPQISPPKMLFPSASLADEAPLPHISTFKTPFPLENPNTCFGSHQPSSPTKPHASNLIVLEDKVLSQDEKIDLTVLGFAKPKSEPGSESEPSVVMPLPRIIKVEQEELPVVSPTVITFPSSVPVNKNQPKKFIVAADKLKLSKDKIAALAKQIKTRAMQQQVQNQKQQETASDTTIKSTTDPQSHVTVDDINKDVSTNQRSTMVRVQSPTVKSSLSVATSGCKLDPLKTSRVELNSSTTSSLEKLEVGSIIQLSPSAFNQQQKFEIKLAPITHLESEKTTAAVNDMAKIGSIIDLSSNVIVQNVTPVNKDTVMETSTGNEIPDKDALPIEVSTSFSQGASGQLTSNIESPENFVTMQVLSVEASPPEDMPRSVLERSEIMPAVTLEDTSYVSQTSKAEFQTATKTVESQIKNVKASVEGETAQRSRIKRKTPAVRIIKEIESDSTLLSAVDFIAELSASAQFNESSVLELSEDELILNASVKMDDMLSLAKTEKAKESEMKQTNRFKNVASVSDATKLLADFFADNNFNKSTPKLVENKELSGVGCINENILINTSAGCVETQTVTPLEQQLPANEKLQLSQKNDNSKSVVCVTEMEKQQQELKGKQQQDGWLTEDAENFLSLNVISKSLYSVNKSQSNQIQSHDSKGPNITDDTETLHKEIVTQKPTAKAKKKVILEKRTQQGKDDVKTDAVSERDSNEPKSSTSKHVPKFKKGKINLVQRKKNVKAVDDSKLNKQPTLDEMIKEEVNTNQSKVNLENMLQIDQLAGTNSSQNAEKVDQNFLPMIALSDLEDKVDGFDPKLLDNGKKYPIEGHHDLTKIDSELLQGGKKDLTASQKIIRDNDRVENTSKLYQYDNKDHIEDQKSTKPYCNVPNVDSNILEDNNRYHIDGQHTTREHRDTAGVDSKQLQSCEKSYTEEHRTITDYRDLFLVGENNKDHLEDQYYARDYHNVVQVDSKYPQNDNTDNTEFQKTLREYQGIAKIDSKQLQDCKKPHTEHQSTIKNDSHTEHQWTIKSTIKSNAALSDSVLLQCNKEHVENQQKIGDCDDVAKEKLLRDFSKDNIENEVPINDDYAITKAVSELSQVGNRNGTDHQKHTADGHDISTVESKQSCKQSPTEKEPTVEPKLLQDNNKNNSEDQYTTIDNHDVANGDTELLKDVSKALAKSGGFTKDYDGVIKVNSEQSQCYNHVVVTENQQNTGDYHNVATQDTKTLESCKKSHATEQLATIDCGDVDVQNSKLLQDSVKHRAKGQQAAADYHDTVDSKVLADVMSDNYEVQQTLRDYYDEVKVGLKDLQDSKISYTEKQPICKDHYDATNGDLELLRDDNKYLVEDQKTIGDYHDLDKVDSSLFYDGKRITREHYDVANKNEGTASVHHDVATIDSNLIHYGNEDQTGVLQNICDSPHVFKIDSKRLQEDQEIHSEEQEIIENSHDASNVDLKQLQDDLKCHPKKDQTTREHDEAKVDTKHHGEKYLSADQQPLNEPLNSSVNLKESNKELSLKEKLNIWTCLDSRKQKEKELEAAKMLVSLLGTSREDKAETNVNDSAQQRPITKSEATDQTDLCGYVQDAKDSLKYKGETKCAEKSKSNTETTNMKSCFDYPTDKAEERLEGNAEIKEIQRKRKKHKLDSVESDTLKNSKASLVECEENAEIQQSSVIDSKAKYGTHDKEFGKDFQTIKENDAKLSFINTEERKSEKGIKEKIKDCSTFNRQPKSSPVNNGGTIAVSAKAFENIGLKFQVSVVEAESDLEVENVDHCTREDSNYYEETENEESTQELLTSKRTRKRLRKTVDIRKGPCGIKTPDETDSDDNGNEVSTPNEDSRRHELSSACSFDDSHGFLGFDETSPSCRNLEESLIRIIAATNAMEKDEERENEKGNVDMKPSDEFQLFKETSEPRDKGNLKNWLTTGKAGQPPMENETASEDISSQVSSKNIMPLKKRWELADQQKRSETDITDDTSPAHVDDDDIADFISDRNLKKSGDFTHNKRRLHDLSNEIEPKEKSVKKVKLSTEEDEEGEEMRTSIIEDIHKIVKTTPINVTTLNFLDKTSGILKVSEESPARKDLSLQTGSEENSETEKVSDAESPNKFNKMWSINKSISSLANNDPQESSEASLKEVESSGEIRIEAETPTASTPLPKKRGRKPKALLVSPKKSIDDTNQTDLKDLSKDNTANESVSESALPKKRGRKPKALLLSSQKSIDLTNQTDLKLLSKDNMANETESESTLPKKRGRKPNKKFFEDTIFSTSTPVIKTEVLKSANVETSKSLNSTLSVGESTSIPRKRGRKPKAKPDSTNITGEATESKKTVIDTTLDSMDVRTDMLSDTSLLETTSEVNAPVPKKRGRKPKDAKTTSSTVILNNKEPNSIIEIFTSNLVTKQEPTEDHKLKNTEVNCALDISKKKSVQSEEISSKESPLSPATSITTFDQYQNPDENSELLNASSQNNDAEKGTGTFNPRLLLIHSRSELNTDKRLTETAGEPGPGFYKCGLCLGNSKKGKWKSHLGEHYGVGWIKGEPELNVRSRSAVLGTMIHYYKETKVKGLTCRLCQRLYRSALGLLTHLETCGTSAEEQMKNRVECEFCKNKYMPLSYPIHKRTCSVRLASIAKELADNGEKEKQETAADGVLNNVGRIKRQSVMKAETKLKEIGEALLETVESEFEPTKHIIHHPPVCAADYHPKCLEDFRKSGKMFCPQKVCTFTCLDFAEMEQHLSECQFKIKPGYHCTLCKSMKVFETQELAVEHVKALHKQGRQVQDFDGDSSDCKIGSEASSSDECSSDVDSDEDEADKNSEDEDGQNKSKKKSNVMKKSYRICKKQSNKNQLYPTRSSNITSDVIKMWQEFTSQNFVDEMLFPYAAPNFKLHDAHNEIIQKLLPRQKISMKFALSKKSEINAVFGLPEPVEWTQLNRFETLSQKNDSFIFIGAPINAIAWAPLPDSSSDGTQFLAVAYRKDIDQYTRTCGTKPTPTLILIYKINKHIEEVSEKIQLHYAVRISNGPVHCFEFVPSGGYASVANRLGLLAVGTASGEICIYPLPLKVEEENSNEMMLDGGANNETKESNGKVNVIDLKPALKLVLDLSTLSEEDDDQNDAKEAKLHCTRIKWSETREHIHICAGYSNGFVGIWDISDDESENLNRFVINEMRHFVPVSYFFTGERGMRDMALHYDTTGLRWIATSSYARRFFVYDLRELGNPFQLDNYSVKNIVNAIDWPIMWENVGLSMGDGFLSRDGLSVLIRSPMCVNVVNSKYDQMICGVNQAKYSPLLSAYISATENGDLLFHAVRELHYDVRRKLGDAMRAWAAVDVKCLQGTKLPKISDKPDESAPRFEPDYKDKYGLVFTPIMKFSPKISAAYKSQERRPAQHLRRYMRVNSLCCNLNAGAHELVACGFENGFLRVLSFRRSKYFK